MAIIREKLLIRKSTKVSDIFRFVESFLNGDNISIINANHIHQKGPL